MTEEYVSESEANELLYPTFEDIEIKEKTESYETMILYGEKFLCALPLLEPLVSMNASEKEFSKAEEERELARAQSSGWDLLEPLNGTCIYYVSFGSLYNNWCVDDDQI